MRTFIVVACLIASVVGDCLIPGLQTAEARTNTNCAWYNSNSCCTSDQANAAVAPFSDGCTAPETKCQQLINLLECGTACSPDISSAIDTSSGQLRVCSKFADHVYSSCSSSQFPNSQGSCETLSSAYSTSKAFWTAQGVEYDTTDSAPTCFNAGSVAQPMIALVVLAAIALIFRF